MFNVKVKGAIFTALLSQNGLATCSIYFVSHILLELCVSDLDLQDHDFDFQDRTISVI